MMNAIVAFLLLYGYQTNRVVYGVVGEYGGVYGKIKMHYHVVEVY